MNANDLHYGPKWAWDQSRPEAILAHAQAVEFHRTIYADQKLRQAERRQQAIAENLPATHSRLVAQVLGRFEIAELCS